MGHSRLQLRAHRDLNRLRELVRDLPAGHRSVNDVTITEATRGEKMSDRITTVVGSWRFIITQSVILGIWLVVNSIGWILDWDPYPFILLNLVLSFQAAFTAPIIMMSQNRQSARDRLASELDFQVNRQAAAEVDAIQTKLNELSDQLFETLAQHRVLLEELKPAAEPNHPYPHSGTEEGDLLV